MENEKAIDVLNTLIEINNDRIEGYETAFKETEEQDLKIFFDELAETSHQCRQELSAEVRSLGGTPTEGTKNTGKFFRVWMDVKAAITGKDRKAILNSCEYGEDNAKGTYENVIKDHSDDLTAEQMAMVEEQYTSLKADHDKVKAMRDHLVEQD